MALFDTVLNDTISALEQIAVTMVLGVVPSTDSIALTDVAVPGFLLWANPQDAIVLTDQTALSNTYVRSLTDTMVVADVPHSWSIPDDQTIEVDFEGDGDLQAVMVKRKEAPALQDAPPPRVVMLPKPPSVLLEHNVVNPNPPKRR